MIRIEVRLFATLRRFAPQGSGEALALEFPAGATVGDVIRQLQLPAEEVKRVFINYRAVAEEHVLQNGDRVGIFPLVAGG
jgi:molybdopterin synthase sulfur carrier subunit